MTIFFAGAPIWLWAVFLVGSIGFILADLFLHKKHEVPSPLNASMWAGASVLFMFGLAGMVWHVLGVDSAAKMMTAYTLEMALSTDNLFAIMAIMGGFGLMTPTTQYMQHKVLLWGIIGALAFRLVLLGTITFITNLVVVQVFGLHINLVFLLFAGIILVTAFGMLMGKKEEDEVDFNEHLSVRFAKKFGNVDNSIASGNFFTKNGMTPLFLCLVCVEAMDVVFAFDSIPVVVGIVKDNLFLVFAATIGACICLRSLYFVLLASRNGLWAVEKAIIILLALVAVKLAVTAFGGHIDTVLALCVTLAILTVGVIVSLVWPQKDVAIQHRHALKVRPYKLELADSLFAK